MDNANQAPCSIYNAPWARVAAWQLSKPSRFVRIVSASRMYLWPMADSVKLFTITTRTVYEDASRLPSPPVTYLISGSKLQHSRYAQVGNPNGELTNRVGDIKTNDSLRCLEWDFYHVLLLLIYRSFNAACYCTLPAQTFSYVLFHFIVCLWAFENNYRVAADKYLHTFSPSYVLLNFLVRNKQEVSRIDPCFYSLHATTSYTSIGVPLTVGMRITISTFLTVEIQSLDW
ncbi:uncharacterized protein K452DRAFT_134251 [Aplosporella prunicola CBS 121167]|uniref:Uncharacterized protein n=1 Tax=Aplosporella prunicola CBS 121167 TaxID=1176127 RepID=A0A6A6BQI5_9PEZI|nr:uncharacterized protein K452DRAFT_134251 [Aplosporella prunicola CBS 121167]KAF2145067.1 hypothetical protein K452DRAFT_134251 [Aplosporella prunicola CBS 121167]